MGIHLGEYLATRNLVSKGTSDGQLLSRTLAHLMFKTHRPSSICHIGLTSPMTTWSCWPTCSSFVIPVYLYAQLGKIMEDKTRMRDISIVILKLPNRYFQIAVLEKTLESPLDRKEISPVYPKGNQPWIFTGRTDAEAPILCPPDVKSWLIGKDPEAGNDWGKEEKGMTEDEMVGWHHWLNGYEFEQTQGDSEGHGSLVCCSSRDPKELDTTYRINSNEITGNFSFFVTFKSSSL